MSERAWIKRAIANKEYQPTLIMVMFYFVANLSMNLGTIHVSAPSPRN